MFDRELYKIKHSSEDELLEKLNEENTIKGLDFIRDIGEILKCSEEDIKKCYRIVTSKNCLITHLSVFYDKEKAPFFISFGHKIEYSSESLDDFSYEVWIALKEVLSMEEVKSFVKGVIRKAFNRLSHK